MTDLKSKAAANDALTAAEKRQLQHLTNDAPIADRAEFPAFFERSLDTAPPRSTTDLLDHLAVAYAEPTKTGRMKEASDYRIAKLLGVSTSTVSSWRVGRSGMSDAQILKVSAMLELDPMYCYQIVQHGRTPSVGMRSVLDASLKAIEKAGRYVRDAAAVLAIITLTSGFIFQTVDARGLQAANDGATSYTLCAYVRMIRRWLRGHLSARIRKFCAFVTTHRPASVTP